MKENEKVNKNVLNQYFVFKCDEIKDQTIKCFEKFDTAWLFRKKKLKNCESLESSYLNCILANNLKSTNEVASVVDEELMFMNNKIKKIVDQNNLQNDFLNMKISEDEYKNKTRSYMKKSNMKEI